MKRLPDLYAVPEDLRLLKRWVVWALEDRGGKATKVPYVPGERRRASVRDPGTWGFLHEALLAAEEAPWAQGVGLVLGEGLVGVDLDGALEEGRPSPLARELLEATATYAEVSPSGRGLHLLLYGRTPSYRRGPLEVYAEGRYFTFTGRALSGRDRLLHDQAFLDWLLARAAPSPPPPPSPRRPPPPEDLEALAARVLRSRYAPLFQGAWRELGYPSQSEADLALAGYLLWLTGGDVALADRLFRLSGLYRAKWDERRGSLTYGERTLRRAMGIRASGPGSAPGSGA